MKFNLSKLFLIVVVSLLTACGGGGSTNPPAPPANVAPVPQAGDSQTVNEQTTVSLAGSGTDADGSIAGYAWTQIAGAAVTLTNADSAAPSFDTPTTTTELTLTFRLTVTDNDGATASDTVDVTVVPVNESPTANAGADIAVAEGSFVNLSGNGADTDGSIASIAWTQVSGTTVNLTTPDQLDTGVTINSGLAGETLVFSFKATDNEGGIATDEISIMVEAALAFVDYTGDVDPGPLANVSIDVTEIGTSSLVPATMATYGYNTIMVSPTDTYNFIIAENNLTLTGTGAPEIAVGDVVVGVTADESAGYAREVTAIYGRVYITAAATLNQAFPDAEVNLDISISNDVLTTASSVKGANGYIQKQSSAVDILRINETLQYEIDPGIYVVEELEMGSAFSTSVGFNIFSGNITRLSTVVSADYSTAVYLDATLAEKYSKSVKKEFKPLFDKSKVILVSGFPVLVNIKAVPVIGAGIDMSTSATLKYGFKVGGAIRSGFEYANDNLNKVAEFRPIMNKIGPEYTLGGGVNMLARASIGVIVTLYDINVDIPAVGKFEFSGPGLGVDLGPYAKFEASAILVSGATPPLTCALDLSVGINSDLSIDYGTLGSQLNLDNPENINLYDLNKSLWNSDVCPFASAVGSLAGTVTGSAAVPLGDVVIQVKNNAGEVIAETTSASDGMYQITEIVSGPYDVFYSKQDYKEANAAVLIAENIATDMPVTLVLDGAGVLQLSVVTAMDPTTLITGATVVIRAGLNNPDGDVLDITYSATAAVDIPLAAGYYTLEVAKTGYVPTVGSVSIKNVDIDGITVMSLQLSGVSCAPGWELEDDTGINWLRSCWDSGGIDQERPYVNGQLNGVEKTYHPSGGVAQLRPFVLGLAQGYLTQYSEGGRLVLMAPYADNLLHGLLISFYRSGAGNLSGTVEYANGLRHGQAKSYYESGELSGEDIWTNGVLVHRVVYNRNGDIISEWP